MDISFPKNPSDGMIFESTSGIFFQFSARNNCWVRVDGLEALGLATPLKDGLMAANDLTKINDLIVPPPQTTLKGEDCPVTFSEGRLRLTSTDESMTVAPKLDVINKIGQTTIGTSEPWVLHENTVGVDFKLNVEKLLDEMIKNGSFTQVQIQGRQGMKGNKGQPGIDELETGPVGEQGTAGQSSPYDGTVGPEINEYILPSQQITNRAIVDITTETGPDGNFLVATRANIGNADACPREVKPLDLSSPLGLVINQKGGKFRKVQSEGCPPCIVCVTSLHYLNLELLADAMFDRFKELVLQLKAEKEELATIWVRAMLVLFNEQKQALCCALENCRSSKRNERTRQFIETQRIQAAQSDHNLVIDGVDDRNIMDMDADKSCPQPGELLIRRGIGCDCAVQYTLDAKIHATDPRSLFLDQLPGTVDTSQTGVFGTNRQGLLTVHQVNERPSEFTADTDLKSVTSRLEVSTDVTPPVQTSVVTNWNVTIDDFAINVSPDRDGTVEMAAILRQNGAVVGRFEKSLAQEDLAAQTITLDSVLPLPFNELASTDKPLELEVEFKSSTTFVASEPLNSVAVDYSLHRVSLNGSESTVNISLSLKEDWNENDWTINGSIILNAGLGFVQFSLPAGDYVAEITDCCANTATGRSEYTGRNGIEFNGTEGTGDDATITRQTVFTPDLGTFNNNADARATYLGTKIEFTHEGGQVRSWVLDPDLVTANNGGSITVCIRPRECFDEPGGTVSPDGAIYVYRGEINPLNLIGLVQPFAGSLTGAENYGYDDVTAGGSDVKIGPTKTIQTTKSFLYVGPDGMTFYTIHGGTGVAQQNTVKMDFVIGNNTEPIDLRVEDDPGEVATPQQNVFNGCWTYGTFGSDGLAFGSLDDPLAGSAWVITVDPKQFGIQQTWQVVGSDGNVFNIGVDANGLGDSLASEPIIFTPIHAGCFMSFKQVQWLERGHRIGASCGGVVELDGQNYIISKRSLGDDVTCGGGESLSNPCVAQFIQLGQGHPAIAWPTINGEEFAGIPTSGVQGFTFDEELSNRVIEKIQAGDITNVNGDPAANIEVVLFPTAT